MGAEGYQVVIGGGADNEQGLARELVSSIAFSDVRPLLEQLFEAYVGRRMQDESFLDFSRRHSIEELRDFVALKEAAAQ